MNVFFLLTKMVHVCWYQTSDLNEFKPDRIYNFYIDVCLVWFNFINPKKGTINPFLSVMNSVKW